MKAVAVLDPRRARCAGQSAPRRRGRHRQGDQRRRVRRSASGYDFLVTGQESLGRVETVGPNVTELQPADYVVATVRRPGSSIYDRIGTYDMTPTTCTSSGASTSATVTWPVVFESMQALAKNGVLVLSSVTGGDWRIEAPADRINLGFVLGTRSWWEAPSRYLDGGERA